MLVINDFFECNLTIKIFYLNRINRIFNCIHVIVKDFALSYRIRKLRSKIFTPAHKFLSFIASILNIATKKLIMNISSTFRSIIRKKFLKLTLLRKKIISIAIFSLRFHIFKVIFHLFEHSSLLHLKLVIKSIKGRFNSHISLILSHTNLTYNIFYPRIHIN